jgi:hypothetical protein
MIAPGAERSLVIRSELLKAQIILILLSADFLASDDHVTDELEVALELHTKRKALVVPIRIGPVDYARTPIASLQSLPRSGTPVVLEPNPELAWAQVAAEIHELLLSAPSSAPDAEESVESSPETLLLTALSEALRAIHDLDNVIRTTIGPVARMFSPDWGLEDRERTIRDVDALAETQVVLPRVRQSVAELEGLKLHLTDILPEGNAALDAVLACGRNLLAKIGDSDVTPWPGPHQLVLMMAGIRNATENNSAEEVKQMASAAMGTVDRPPLAEADRLLGLFRVVSGLRVTKSKKGTR